MAVAWSWAFDPPFKWTKQIASHFGGTRQVGDFVAGPHQRLRRHPPPVPSHHRHGAHDPRSVGHHGATVVRRIKQKPIEGVSMVYAFDKANATAASTRKTQYFEMIANRGKSRGLVPQHDATPRSWILNAPLPAPQDYKRELYNLSEDYPPCQRPRAENARQAEGNAGAVRPGGEDVQRASAEQRYVCAGARAATGVRRQAGRYSTIPV